MRRKLGSALFVLTLFVGCDDLPKANDADSMTAARGVDPLGEPPAVPPVVHGPVIFEETIVKQGVHVEFTARLAHDQSHTSAVIREGDDVLFRFKVADENDAPLRRIYPAAWLDKRIGTEKTDAKVAVRKVEKFVAGGLFSRPELDLNSYYVLALNDDATITVLDPVFGFGGTKLLAIVKLDGVGEDWAISDNQRTVFVSIPTEQQIAVVDSVTWEVRDMIPLRACPESLALQPDQRYLWVTCRAAGGSDPAGVRAIASDGLRVAARIPTGPGPHQLAVSDDSSWVFVSNAEAGTVSVIDARKLQVRTTIDTGPRPVSVAYSSLAGMAYITHENGAITVVDPLQRRVVARMQAGAGLGQIRFAPGGRYALAVNPKANVVHVVDATQNQIVQTGDTRMGPDTIAFSDEMAYVRHRDSETIQILPLKQIGLSGVPLSATEFPGGQIPPGRGAAPSRSDAIVPAPGESAVLVANPVDRTIYYYKEGMSAPMGQFSNYSRQPRAVLCVDHSLRERTTPGVYETIARIRTPGAYDVAFFLDAPRIVHCFEMHVEPDSELERERNKDKLTVELLGEPIQLKAGRTSTLQFRVSRRVDQEPKQGIDDLMVQAFLAPGIWHKRHAARELGMGLYEVDLTPPRTGVYYLGFEAPSTRLALADVASIVLRCAEEDYETPHREKLE